MPEPEEIRSLIAEIDMTGLHLTAWEVDFVRRLVDNPPPTFSDEQIIQVVRIYDERC